MLTNSQSQKHVVIHCHFGSSSRLESREIFLLAACLSDVVEEGCGDKPGIEPEVAIIATWSGQDTIFVYAPSPIQGLSQLIESEAADGKSSLLAPRMDFDTIGYRNSGEGWVRRICREHRRGYQIGAGWKSSAISWTPLRGVVTNSRKREEQQGTGMQTS